MSLISLVATPIMDRRRLSSHSSRLSLTVTIRVPDEETQPTDSGVAITPEQFAGQLARLNSGGGLGLAAALGVNITVAQDVQISTSTQQVQSTCPLGHWCSAANRIECVANTYQPKRNQVDAGACLACPAFSESLAASTAKVIPLSLE